MLVEQKLAETFSERVKGCLDPSFAQLYRRAFVAGFYLLLPNQ